MAFRLRRDVRSWFKDITFSLDFDMYYLCLMAGLATGRKEMKTTDETTELTDYFPGEFKTRGRIIVAMFLTAELKKHAIHPSERRQMDTVIRELIQPLSPSGLSDMGFREINKYAHGGFDDLTEWFAERPRSMEIFLPNYKQNLDQALAKHPK
jgi:hypothetical protein